MRLTRPVYLAAALSISAAAQTPPPSWQPINAAQRPSPRSGHAMAFDAGHGQTVLFGGTGPDGVLGDTWVFDGSNWTQKTSTISPTPRTGAGMAYDPLRGQVVLFGGFANGFLNDTWTWDGDNWVSKSPANIPTVGPGYALVFDSVRAEVVLFKNLPTGTETWAWDGINWTKKTPASTPAPLLGYAMAYDSLRQQTVLFGEQQATVVPPTVVRTTQVWDGTTWTPKSPANSPDARTGHVMAFDSIHGETILFGGASCGTGLCVTPTVNNETWIWDGANWSPRTPLANPLPRSASALVFESGRNQSILFGGSADSGYLDDTWSWHAELLGRTVPVTVNTAAAGVILTIDGAFALSPQTLNWAPASIHTIGADSSGTSAGARYVFTSWSDGGAIVHDITVPSSAATYTATYATQYLLTTHDSPTGAILASLPSPDGYYDSGTQVQLTAQAAPGFRFDSWSGALTGSANPQILVMSAPREVFATFVPQCIFTLSSTTTNIGSGSGTTGASVTGSFQFTPGSGCTPNVTWTATSDSPRLAFTSGTSGNGGTGPVTIAFRMLTNSSSLPRTAHILIDTNLNGLVHAGYAFTVTQAGSTETQSQRVVRALYQTILGREPDSGGWSFWTGPGAPSASGVVLYNQMADGFYTSPEFRNSGFAVLAIYQAILGHVPAFSQWLSTVTQVRNGSLTTAQLVQNLSVGLPNTNFVQQAIQNSWARQATANEVSLYSGQINNGLSRSDFLNNVIFASNDFIRNTNPLFVDMLFYTILVRDPDSDGFNFWLNQVNTPPGQPGIYPIYLTPPGAYAVKLAVIGQAVPPNPNLLGFLGSPEFQALIQ